MAFEKRFILLLVIIVIGVASAFVFLNWTTSAALDDHPNWDMIWFVPGGADVDNLYLIFGTIPWTFVAFLWSVYGAGFFILINKLEMRSRKLSIESVEPKLSLTRLITRAIVPAMFSYSIAEVILEYVNQLSLVLFRPGYVPTLGDQRINPFLATAVHESLLFLPITLAVFIPTWILNDFMVISRLKDTKPGEFSDPVKVGQWVSGLLGGFSMIAFPLAFLRTFLFVPFEISGWNVIINRTPVLLGTLVSVLAVLIAYVLPVIILYEAAKSGIAKRFSKVADRLGVERSKLATSYLAQDEPKDESDEFDAAQYAEMEDDEKLSSPDYETMEAGVRLDEDAENDNTVSGG